MLNRYVLHVTDSGLDITKEGSCLFITYLQFPLCVYSDKKITEVINCNVLSVPQVRWMSIYYMYIYHMFQCFFVIEYSCTVQKAR